LAPVTTAVRPLWSGMSVALQLTIASSREIVHSYRSLRPPLPAFGARGSAGSVDSYGADRARSLGDLDRSEAAPPARLASRYLTKAAPRPAELLSELDMAGVFPSMSVVGDEPRQS